MEIDALFESETFRSQNQSFKDDFDEQLFYLLANNLPTSAITANNSFILQRMNILFADVQHLISQNNVELISTHVFGSQANGLALKDSDIDLTILTKTQARKETPNLYFALQKIPESRFLKLGFHQKFTFNMMYHPVMKGELIQISNIQTKKYPTHLQSIDLILNGYDGIKNSLAVSQLVQTSKAYHYLVLSLKLWLSQFPRKRRMPLYSYYIMAAHYLQNIVHPALIPPKVDLRAFKEESFREKLLTQSPTPLFKQVDITGHQGFSGLSSLLKGFFNYYGIQYHMNDKKPTIFVNQYKTQKSHKEVEKPKPSKSASKLAFNILDPLSEQLILDLKVFEKKNTFHVQDMEDAFHRLNSNQNIFSQKIMTEKNLNSFKLTKNNSEREIQNDSSKLFLFTNTTKDDFKDDDEFNFIPKNSQSDLDVFPEKPDFALDNQDDEYKATKKKRITRRVNDILERKILFRKQNQSEGNPRLLFQNQKQKQSSQSDDLESDLQPNQKRFSEVQQHLLQKRSKISKQFAEIRVKNFSKILRVLPK